MKKLLLFITLCPVFLFGQTQIGADIDGEAVFDYSGFCLSLSLDGSIVAIGAYGNNDNGSDSGHVRVYKNNAGVWEQIGIDIDGEAANDESGRSVSLSSDGSIVAIGAPYNDGNGFDSGHVRVYKNNAGVWEQIGDDINGEASEDYSGISVSLSSDGSIVAIGAHGNDENGAGSGHVRVYKNNAGVWEQIGADIDGDSQSDASGLCVSLSSDGSIVAISSPYDNFDVSGNVRVYKNNAGAWQQIGDDINGENAFDNFGTSVYISSDGSIVAIGSPFYDGNGSNSGYVRVYKNNAGVWEQIGVDINGEAAGDYSGRSVSLSSDGSILAIGAIYNDGNGNASGHVRIYKNNVGVWEQIGTDIDGENIFDSLGISVSLSSDGSVVAIGALENDGNGSNSGHVRVYDLGAVLSSDNFVLSQFTLFPNPAKNKVTIDLKAGLELLEIIVYNNLGQQIMASKNLVIDTSSLNIGLYYLQIKTDKGNGTKKLIIE